MPNNNVDQAPKIRSIGEKSPDFLNKDRNSWGKAIRPHELETIIANCLDSKSFAQYKLMMFLTGNAEEKFDVSLKNVMNRCNLSKVAYYNARKALEQKGWLFIEEEEDKVYIVINYNKIYQDGKECISLNTTVPEESITKYTTVKEGISLNTTFEEGISEFTTVLNENNKNNMKEGISLNTTLEEGYTLYTKEGYTKKTEEGYTKNTQYNIDNNNINKNNISSATPNEEAIGKNFLQGAAANF